MQVLVRDNNVDQALKALKKKMQREGIFREMKLRGHYEKPSEKKAREKAEAIRRARKLARKKMQREGLLPMKPRVVPGAGGPGRAVPVAAVAAAAARRVSAEAPKRLRDDTGFDLTVWRGPVKARAIALWRSVQNRKNRAAPNLRRICRQIGTPSRHRTPSPSQRERDAR